MVMRDIVIVGSGFGAAVMAARLGAYLKALDNRQRVLVIEKGPDTTGQFDPEDDSAAMNAQGNVFKQSYAPDYLAGVADYFADNAGAYRPGVSSMNVIAGRGTGGGSNVYCGVSLRAPAETFEQTREGRRLWPSLYSREVLNPFYDVVEQLLRVRQMQWTDENAPHWALACKRDLVFAEGARQVGATCVPLKLADDNDPNEGWWTQGRRFQGRHNLTQNYLQLAREEGVEFWTRCEVDRIAPDGEGYVVTGTDRRGGGERQFDVECKVLMMGAGCVGSTGLLLRSEDEFPSHRPIDLGKEQAQAPVLGRHLSSNGDYGVTGFVGPRYERAVEGHKGKPMSSFSPSWWREHKFIVIPFHTPPLYLAQGQIASLVPAQHPDAVGRGSTRVAEGPDGRPLRQWGQGFKDRLKLFSDKVLTMGCLCWDACEGEVRLTPEGRFDVVWPQTHPDTEARWSAAATAMRSIYRALGGDMMLDTYRSDGTVNTAHPLGSCRMAEDDESTLGVVNPLGECFANRNLFVVDGAIIPSALGVNPTLTIAAVAELIAERLIAGEGTESIAERLG